MSDKNKSLKRKNPIPSLKIFTKAEGNKSMLHHQGQEGICLFLKNLQDSKELIFGLTESILKGKRERVWGKLKPGRVWGAVSWWEMGLLSKNMSACVQRSQGCLFVCDLLLPWLKNVSFLYLFKKHFVYSFILFPDRSLASFLSFHDPWWHQELQTSTQLAAVRPPTQTWLSVEALTWSMLWPQVTK